jgi:hypothetical protein
MCLCSHRVVVKQQYGSIEDSAICWRLILERGQRLQGGALTFLRCEDGSVCPQATWQAWAINLIDQRIEQHTSSGGIICHDVGAAIGIKSRQVREDLHKEIAALRDELKTMTNKLYDELYRELNLLRMANQERQDLERALHQANLDASTARIDGAIEAAIVKLRSEFDIEGLRKQFRTDLGRLPIIKDFRPQTVHYEGDIVTCNGATYQARCDTGEPVTSQDWICIARAGRDGINGDTPRFCGAFNAHAEYRQFDIAEFDGSSFIALDNDPGIPGDPGWQLLCGKGNRGVTGGVGPRGQKGERGPRGEAAPTIISWVLDRARYTAYPTMSNGTAGAPLELRGLFEQFLVETGGWGG